MVDFVSVAVIIGEVYFFSFLMGYFLLRRNFSFPFFVMLPIRISLGLSTLALIAFIASFLLIHKLVLIIPVFIVVAFILPKMLREKSNIITLNIRNIFENLVPLILFLISYIYFSIATGIMSWPPPGDIIGHGLLTSLLRYTGKLSFTLEPLIQFPFYYPAGMHVFAANLADLMGLFSGEAVLVTGALISSLIPPLLFSLTYITTRSSVVSLLPFLASFYIHSSGPLMTWIMGYFYNGPYPNLFGFLLSILVVCLLIFARKGSLRALGCTVLILFQLFMSYPPLILTIGPLSLLLVGSQLLNFIKSANRKLLLLIFVALTIFAVLIVLPLSHIWLRVSLYDFEIDFSFFYDPSVVVTVLATVMSSFLLVKGQHKEVSLFFLGTFVPAIATLDGRVYMPIRYIFPERLIVLSWIFSWIVVSSFIGYLSKVYKKSSNKHTTHIKTYWSKLIFFKILCLFLLLIFIAPSVSEHFTFASARRYAGYSRSPYFPYDHKVSTWISENVPPDERILNDLSLSGFYLPSYTYKTVIFHHFPHPPEYDEAKQVWLHPDNESLVRLILRKLNIKWVFVTSSDYYFDTWLYGGDQNYKKKPFRPADYGHFFDSYQFLQIAFGEGNTRIYKVIWSS